MLKLTIRGVEVYDEENNEFYTPDDVNLTLEHSLVSLAAWESKWKKDFLSNDRKTSEETISYVQIMTLTPDVPDDVYLRLTDENVRQITAYIEDSHTATTFSEMPNQPIGREKITSEIIYYWMTALSIPFEPCETWHLGRLLALVKVNHLKNSPKKKVGRADQMAQQRALNAQRRAEMQNSG